MKIILMLLVFGLGACAERAAFTGSHKSAKAQDNKPVNSVTGDSDASPSSDSQDNNKQLFASKGKSLDAYFLIDVSKSLEHTDPDCLRFKALTKFRENMIKIMGSDGDVRVSLITFSTDAEFHFTDNAFLQLSTQDFASKYFRKICQTKLYTNTKEGFDLTLSTAKQVIENFGAKENISLLFFTDGEPSIPYDFAKAFTEADLYESANALQQMFPQRIFSLLLGDGLAISNQHPILSTVTPLEFLQFLSGDPLRVAIANTFLDIQPALDKFLGI